MEIKHLNRQIAPFAHTPMYNFHKFWSRKTWNVVGQFIETYCPENGIVLDPFCGSGVTAIEALKRGRKAIVCDITPIATELTRLTIKFIKIEELKKAFKRIEGKVKDKILELYKTRCRNCGKEIHFDCAIWQNNKCISIRYKECLYCKDNRTGINKLDEYDNKLLNNINRLIFKEWYPKNPLYHINGQPFKEKQKYESLDELFTKRNLYALAILMEAIEEEKKYIIRDFLKLAFTSMVHLCSRMNPISEAGHFTPFSSAWVQHSYWFPSGPYMEQNVWNKFESSILGHQGLINAKEESNKYFKDVKFGRSYKDVISGKADIYIYTGSCLTLMEKMGEEYSRGCIDYIFTDPPYDSSIQYGELTYLWVAWLKKDKGYLEKIASDEIIHNERQDKNFEVYHSLLKNAFQKMFSLLKPDKYLNVTFHNPTFKVRNATIRAGVLSGFEFHKIHHQELARPSAKSLLQPFGSAQGDFYLRFYKPNLGKTGLEPKELDEYIFEKIVVDTTIKILAERGEPTPYTIIINAIDPELAKWGYFSELDSGLDIKTILENHLNDEFTLEESKIGEAKGKSWWFENPKSIKHLETIPLSERVEETVIRKLQQFGRVTFTDMWEAINVAFPNSLTSDQTSIREALETYARPIQCGYWLIKDNFKKDAVKSYHSNIIAIISEIGKNNKFKIYIGKKEQSGSINIFHINKSGKLRQYVDYDEINKLENIVNPDIVDDIDVLWIKNNKIEYAFEVECTTSMTSALVRCSNIDKAVTKIMIIPNEREKQFKNRMKNPVFKEICESDNWSILLFDKLLNRKNFNININELINIHTKDSTKQLELLY